MTWIETIGVTDAEGELAAAYRRLMDDRGKVSNIMSAQSLDPRAMQAHLDLYLSVMFGRSGLSREEREMIAVAVSALNRCAYCIAHHCDALNRYWRDAGRVERFAEDFRAVEVPERMQVVLDYAEALTLAPASVLEGHVLAMKAAGLSDREVLTVNLVIAYFNFVNRIAAGLGVESTAEERAGYDY